MNADILIFRGVVTLYTYTVDKEKTPSIQVGSIVTVSFGKSTVKGLVVSLASSKSSLKPILKEHTDYIAIPEPLVSLILWFYNYYQTTPYKAFQTISSLKKIRPLPQLIHNDPIDIPPPLTHHQKHVVESISNNWIDQKHIYLHGITGSGKTEVYLALSKKILDQGKDVLFLLPEIALTPQFTTLIQRRFGTLVAVLHSGLTPKQKEIEWNRIYHGHAKIIIGPRSAIFAPCQNLGLIIMDEEHEPSYKQENHPRYLTHTIALERSRSEHASLILGSATPNIERYYQTQTLYSLYTLKERATGAPLPQVITVDMKKETELGLKTFISNQLYTHIQECLEKKKKTLILINRRGFATFINCQRCGSAPQCPECHLGYTYHQDRSFRCHRCHIKIPATNYCERCNKHSLMFSGLGIQKVQLELKRTFPNANILRLDKDIAKNLNEINSILNTFKQEGDILIGTQMIAKGHDIEGVNLVGVLGIDTTLSMPDFRSPERTFQLLTQVAGRAGRHKDPGTVIVQTYRADHYAIKAAQNHDFDSFFEEEINFRESLNYPPFCSLINIIFSALEKETAYCVAQKFFNAIQPFLEGYLVDIMGPKPAPIEKAQDYYRWNIVFKFQQTDASFLKSLIKLHIPKHNDVRIIVDFDPYHIL